MHRHRALVLTALLIAAGTLPAIAGGNANFLLGHRSVGDEDFWGEDQDQTVAGIMVDFGREGWPIHLCLATMDSSSSDGSSVTRQVSEFALGVIKVWEPQSAVRPYLGGGLAAVSASFVIDVANGHLVQDDTTSGFYVDGGVFWRTGERFNIGLGARFMTQAKIELEGVRGEADYSQFHLMLGWGWPRREKSTPAAASASTP